MKHILYCQKCKKYTMKETCCENKTINTKPPRYLQNKIIKEYRLKAKKCGQ
ncbi:ribosome biogenesis protein [Candidatus Woesearchaeota archaeon]|nr:ribosome biogenesis protein [Candidatus Woesearchaeota archaeon]